jgi:putative SOS response-associated peptidase YedK
MCNLYSMTAAREAVLRLFRIGDNRAESFEGRTAYFPGHDAPIVRQAADGARELVTLSWGFVLPQPGRAPRRVTNCRDDKLDSGFWAPSYRTRRCLVPATSFAEPRDVTPATWHWFAASGAEPRPLFAFAGLWRRHVGPIRKDGPSVELDVFAFLTTLPNERVAAINHERMPVLLFGTDAWDTWLDGSAEDARQLVATPPTDAVREVQAGFDKLDLLGGPPIEQGPAARRLL